jgi:membrane protease YdiL (CAAX protease family)
MLRNWGPTNKGLNFYYAEPLNQSGWLKLLGLFGVGLLFSFIGSLLFSGLGALLSWVLQALLSGLGNASGYSAQAINAWIGVIVPSLFASVGAGLGMINAARIRDTSSGALLTAADLKVNWWHFTFGVLAYFAIQIPLGMVSVEVVKWIVPDAKLFGEEFDAFADWAELVSPTPLYFVYLLALAPIVWLQTGVEEIAFRGAWLKQLGAMRCHWLVGVLATSVVFGFFHIGSDWVVLVTIGVMAVSWAYAAMRFGDISFGWGAHFINNYYLFAFLPLLPIEVNKIGKVMFNEGPRLSDPNGAFLVFALLLVYFLGLLGNIVFVRWLTQSAPMPKTL